MPDLPPPSATQVEAVIVHPPRLAPLGGEAAFSAVRIGPEALKVEPRLDEALRLPQAYPSSGARAAAAPTPPPKACPCAPSRRPVRAGRW